LDQVSFQLEAGDFLALLGPNGSGKSTLLKAIAGIYDLGRPGCSGQIRYQGVDFLSLSPSQKAQTIAYVAPHLQADFPMTALDAVFLGRTCYSSGWFVRKSDSDRARVQRAMEQCFCWELRDRNLGTLSGGERQLVAIARALAQGSQVLFLDEALSAMDLNHQAAIGKTLKKLAIEGKSIVMVSHDLNLASEWANSALLIKDGKKILQGPIREMLTQENLAQLYPNSDLIVGKHPQSGAPKVFFRL
jgi:iron complex transport system ATP-binding protein